MWNFLLINRDKLFKLVGFNEECYKIVLFVNVIVDFLMFVFIVDIEYFFYYFWDIVIEELLKFFFDGFWLVE